MAAVSELSIIDVFSSVARDFVVPAFKRVLMLWEVIEFLSNYLLELYTENSKLGYFLPFVT